MLAVREHWEDQVDREKSKKPMKRDFKFRALDIYKSKFYIDYYNFIAYCKDYFATSRFKDCNQVLLAATFFKKKVLNHWQ